MNQLYRVTVSDVGTYEVTVPAADKAEAERHARRLYDENCGPYEFANGAERVTWGHAREVIS